MFVIYRVHAENLSSGEFSSLAGAKDLLELREGEAAESSEGKVKALSSLVLNSLERVAMSSSSAEESIDSSSKVIPEVLGKTKSSSSMLKLSFSNS